VSFVKVAKTSDLEPGFVIEVQVKGVPYAVCNVDGEICAMSGECACTGGPLGYGRIQDGALVCPWHGWRYHHRTGVMQYDDSISVPTFAVKVVGEDVYLNTDRSKPTSEG
jgi:nitrite reductase/ring-hydroxylating ferredoxin subunit